MSADGAVNGRGELHPLRAADGTRLFRRTWAVPETIPRTGSLLLVHGLGEHCGRYESLARVLTGLGVEVHSYDHRGFGRSEGARGVLPHASALVDDAALVFARMAVEMRQRGEGRPAFVLGHSMGGCIVARAVTSGVIVPRGMVLSSPALLPRLSLLQRAAAAVLSHVLPGMAVPHRLPLDQLSHDPAVRELVLADAYMHDRVTPRLVASLRLAGQRAIDDAPRCRVPTLLLVAGDDRLVDPEGSMRFQARLPHGVGTLHRYAGAYHELFNEVPEYRDRVLADLERWLRGQLALER